jgi:hypothetical protein
MTSQRYEEYAKECAPEENFVLKIIDLNQEDGIYKKIDGEDALSVDMKDDATIEFLKSYLLNITENQPFYLKHHMGNTDTLADLKKRTTDWNKEVLGLE